MHGFLSRDGMPPADLLAPRAPRSAGYGVEIVDDRVIARAPASRCGSQAARTVQARQILLATGATDELPDIAGARERWGRDFLHCPYCHGWEVRDQRDRRARTGPSVEHAHLLRQWSTT